MHDAQSNSPASGLEKRYFQVARREIGYLRFICESYDGLVFLRTLDAAAGLVEVAWPRQRGADAAELLAALAAEIGLQAVARPSELPPL